MARERSWLRSAVPFAVLIALAVAAGLVGGRSYYFVRKAADFQDHLDAFVGTDHPDPGIQHHQATMKRYYADTASAYRRAAWTPWAEAPVDTGFWSFPGDYYLKYPPPDIIFGPRVTPAPAQPSAVDDGAR